MTLSRAQVAADIANRSGQVLTSVGLAATDTAGNMKEPLDDAFLATGTAYADLATATLEEAALERFRAIALVHITRRALTAAIGFADVAATQLGVSKKKSQVVDNLERMLARAELEASSRYGFDVQQVMTQGRYQLDIIEPEAVA